jgi:hypothetical protein
MKRFGYIFAFSIIFVGCVFAAPKEIVIIRHADKLDQAETGPVLSAKGHIRAMKFAFYFLDKFGNPDYIFAANPVEEIGRNSSIRPIETIAPLANMLQEKFPQLDVPILHSYENNDYSKLAKYILSEKKYNGKLILICWSHGKIPSLATKLGVTQTMPEWQSDDYDSVYILKYDVNGHVKDFSIMSQQYPVEFNGTWKDLFALVQK